MTPEELAAIRARAEAATPGPWTVDEGLAHADPWLEGEDVWYRHIEGWTDAGYEWLCLSPEDAEFIAHAREDIPRLLDEVEALRARAERAEAMCVALRNALNAMGVTFSADETRLAALVIGGKPVDHYPDMEARIERIAAAHARRLELIAADDPGAQIRMVVDAARRFVQALDATEASIRPDPEGVIDGPHGQALRAAVAALDAAREEATA